MSAIGNVFGGFLQGATDTLVTKPKNEIPLLPIEPHDFDNKSTGMEIFGMKPLNFGLVAVGLIAATVITVKLVKNYK